MATKQTGIKLSVSAVNSTGRVFKNIASSAMSVTASIAKWGAAAAGVALGGFAVMVNKLGDLSDIAQAAGTTTDEITKLSGALDILGIKGSKPEELASAFQRMVRNTGMVGVEGFHKLIEEISKLPTIQERATAATAAFGKTGQQFLPIIEGAAQNGVEWLKKVEAGFPGISQAAADSCAAASNAMKIMWNGIKSVFAEGVGKIAQMIDSDFKGGVREAAMVGAAQLQYFARVGFRYVSVFVNDTSGAFRQLGETITRWARNIAEIIREALSFAIDAGREKLNGFFYKFAAGVDAAWQHFVVGDDEAANRAIALGEAEDKRVSDAISARFNKMKSKMSSLQWGLTQGVLSNVDISDLQAQRDAAVAAAKAAGEAYGKAAVKVGAETLAKIKTENEGVSVGRRGADKTNPEAVMGSSYKALTYALRQGYASGIEEVKSLIKKVVTGVAGVKEAVEENGLNAVPAVGG